MEYSSLNGVRENVNKKEENKKEGERNRNENTNSLVKEAKLPSSDGIGPDNALVFRSLNGVRENVNKKEKNSRGSKKVKTTKGKKRKETGW